MSDVLKSLLQAYSDKLDIYRTTTLSYIRHHAIVAPGLPDPTTLYGMMPLVLIQADGVTLSPDCMEGSYVANLKQYTVRLTGYLEYFDDGAGMMGNSSFGTHGAIDLATDLEEIFDRNTLEITQSCVLTSITYNQIALSQAPAEAWLHTCDLIFSHLYLDRRIP